MIAHFAQADRTAGLLGLILLVAIGCSTTGDRRGVAKNEAASTQPASTHPASRVVEIGREGNLITCVYDIRDFLVEIEDFDNPPALGIVDRRNKAPATRPASMPANNSDNLQRQTPEQPAQSIAKLIQETIEPVSWRDAGGAVGSLKALKGQLVITQTAQAHEQIKRLLAQLRENRQIQITTEARFIYVSEATMDKLKELAKPEPLLGHPASQPTMSGTYLTNPQVNQILNAAQAAQDSSTLSAPRVTTFNGQRAYVLVATQRAYVADLKLVMKEGKPALDPVVDVVESGLVFDVCGTVSADRKFVTMTLRPQLTQLERIDTVPFGPLPEELKNLKPVPTIQQPVMHIVESKVTVSVPNGQTLLLGGQRVRRDLVTHEADKGKQMGYLLILVKPTIILPAEQDSRSYPLLQAAPRK